MNPGEKGCPSEGELAVSVIYPVHGQKEVFAPSLFGEEGELIHMGQLRDRDPDETDGHLESKGFQNLCSGLIDGITVLQVLLEGPVTGKGIKVGIAEGEGNGPSLDTRLP